MWVQVRLQVWLQELRLGWAESGVWESRVMVPSRCKGAASRLRSCSRGSWTWRTDEPFLLSVTRNLI